MVGEEKKYDEKTGIIVWDIPYTSGQLEAVGLSEDDKALCRYAIVSSKQPYALTVEVEKKTIKKENGIAQLKVHVVDKEGIPVMLSDNEVTCSITGPAILLGLEAGNNKDMTDYTDSKQRVFQGKILAYIQATGKAGLVTVKFTSPWLEPIETTLEVK